jgi:Mg2+ and Co2+ transporter CorA
LVLRARRGLLSLRRRKRDQMIEDTIGKIETRIQGADSIKDDRRRELLQLLGTLKSEVAELSRTHGDQAASIAGFTELSTHEATRAEQDPKLLKLSLEGMASSVSGFEQSHPRLVRIVNAISQTLSNLGI